MQLKKPKTNFVAQSTEILLFIAASPLLTHTLALWGMIATKNCVDFFWNTDSDIKSELLWPLLIRQRSEFQHWQLGSKLVFISCRDRSLISGQEVSLENTQTDWHQTALNPDCLQTLERQEHLKTGRLQHKSSRNHLSLRAFKNTKILLRDGELNFGTQSRVLHLSSPKVRKSIQVSQKTIILQPALTPGARY